MGVYFNPLLPFGSQRFLLSFCFTCHDFRSDNSGSTHHKIVRDNGTYRLVLRSNGNVLKGLGSDRLNHHSNTSRARLYLNPHRYPVQFIDRSSIAHNITA